MGDPHIVTHCIGRTRKLCAERVNGFGLTLVSDSTPKVSRILQQVMYFESMEFVLRSGPLENVRSCGPGMALAELHP
jgi:hypothetical protein